MEGKGLKPDPKDKEKKNRGQNKYICYEKKKKTWGQKTKPQGTKKEK